MENVVLYIIIGFLILGIASFIIYKIGKVVKMQPEERKKLLITYLKGLVAQAEQHIGSGHGAEKLAEVEKYFQEKAPFLYKMCLRLVGKDSLKELIEIALKEIKDSFEK